jgi:rare lipoprotein A
MRRHTAHGLAILLSVVSLGAAQGTISSETGSPQKVIPKQQAASPVEKRAQTKAYQIGTASWYGTSFHGRPTASGEPYNMFDLTAAHPTLPLGTHVRVTNLRNGRAVVVRINDRGPAVPGRIIDLSYSAARVLDLKAWGLQRVRLDVVKPQTIAVLRPVEN